MEPFADARRQLLRIFISRLFCLLSVLEGLGSKCRIGCFFHPSASFFSLLASLYSFF